MELAAELGHEHSQIVSVLKHSPKIPLGRRLSASVFRRASSCPNDLKLQRELVDLAQGAVHGCVIRTQYRSKAVFYRAQPRSQGKRFLQSAVAGYCPKGHYRRTASPVTVAPLGGWMPDLGDRWSVGRRPCSGAARCVDVRASHVQKPQY